VAAVAIAIPGQGLVVLAAAVAMAILLLAAVATAKHPSTTRDQIRPEQQLEGGISIYVSFYYPRPNSP